MSYDSLLVHTVTIITADTDVDRYGDSEPDWTDTTEVETPARMVQRTAVQLLENRDASITEWVAFLPGDVVVVPQDRIRWGSLTFEVAGDPKPAVRRSDTVHHQEAPLRRVVG